MFLFYRRSYQARLIMGLIGGLLALVPLLYFSLRGLLAAAPFASLQPAAAEACQASLSAPVDAARPYRIGKLLIVSPNGIALGQVMADQALAGIIASRAGEVGTLVCVGSSVQVKTSSSSACAPLYRQYRDIRLIELASGAVLYRTSLGGSQPRQAGG